MVNSWKGFPDTLVVEWWKPFLSPTLWRGPPLISMNFHEFPLKSVDFRPVLWKFRRQFPLRSVISGSDRTQQGFHHLKPKILSDVFRYIFKHDILFRVAKKVLRSAQSRCLSLRCFSLQSLWRPAPVRRPKLSEKVEQFRLGSRSLKFDPN